MLRRNLRIVGGARQVAIGCFNATAATRPNPKLTLEIGQCASAIGHSGLQLAFGNRITDANKHENNYHLTFGENQLLFAIFSTTTRLNIVDYLNFARALRSEMLSMPSASRYFATVRRAIVTPCCARQTTI
jgi:hypothetical protein